MPNNKPQWIIAAEERSASGFDVQAANRKLQNCKIDRLTSGWYVAALDGWRIRDNDLPLGKPAGLPAKYKGKYYKDSWLVKGIRFKVSMLTGGDVEIDVKPVDSYNYQTPTDTEADPVDLLDSEVNSNWEVMDADTAEESQLYDWYYTGLGVTRGIWDTEEISPQFLTGTPHIYHVPSMQVFLDPASKDPALKDMRYLFHEEFYDVDYLKREYPEYQDSINAEIDEKRMNANDTCRIVTMQYKETVKIKKVFIEDKYSGQKWGIPLEEFLDDLQEEYLDPENLTKWEATDQSMDYKTWINEGGFLPEKQRIVGTLTVKQTMCFQVIFLANKSSVLLEKPQYVGSNYTYFFLCGNQHSNTVYPFGAVDELKDLQEMDIAATTIYTQMLFKYYMTKPNIIAGSLLNEKDFRENFYKLDCMPLVDPEWQRKNPGVRAVEYPPLPEPPRAFLELHDRINNAQRELTGAVEAAVGQQQNSGQSGIAIAQLQAASANYLREDISKYRNNMKDVANWLKNSIVLHRNYPHYTKSINMHNDEVMYPVAFTEYNKMSDDTCYVVVTIQANQEITKQIEQQLAFDLLESKLISKLDALRKLPVNNPDRLNDNRMAEDGMNRLAEVVEASQLSPDQVSAVFQQIIAQSNQQGKQIA